MPSGYDLLPPLRGHASARAGAPSAQKSSAELAITAVGMLSPVGADVAQTFSSVRAGIRRMLEHRAIYQCVPESPDFEPPTPLIASAIQHLDSRARAGGRMAEWLGTLAGQAFRELLIRSRLSDDELARTGVFLALPARDGLGIEQQEEIAYHFHNAARCDLLPNFRVAFGGNGTALALAELAVAQIRAGQLDRVAVGGADSWLHRPWLEALDRDWRLLTERNPDGFQPGEAAAFAFLEPSSEVARRGLVPLAEVRGFTNSRFEAEKGLPNTGVELAAVLEPLLPTGAAPLLICDLNGISSRTKEWAYALSRLGAKLKWGYALEHPASVLGDIGAATGAALIALTVQWMATKHVGRRALIWAASDDGERRALALERT